MKAQVVAAKYSPRGWFVLGKKQLEISDIGNDIEAFNVFASLVKQFTGINIRLMKDGLHVREIYMEHPRSEKERSICLDWSDCNQWTVSIIET